MNDKDRIEELSQEVRRLQKRSTRLTIIVAVLVVLYFLTDLLGLITTIVFDPYARIFLIVPIFFTAFLLVIFCIDTRWGLGESE